MSIVNYSGSDTQSAAELEQHAEPAGRKIHKSIGHFFDWWTYHPSHWKLLPGQSIGIYAVEGAGLGSSNGLWLYPKTAEAKALVDRAIDTFIAKGFYANRKDYADDIMNRTMGRKVVGFCYHVCGGDVYLEWIESHSDKEADKMAAAVFGI